MSTQICEEASTLGNGRRATSELFNSFVLRPYDRADRARVTQLLRFLPELYPNGDLWLQRRLSDVERGTALCTVAVVGGSQSLAGLTIETPKARGSVKLSTIYVRPECRLHGIGSLLLRRAHQRWAQAAVRSAHVTVDQSRLDSLAPLLRSTHFMFVAVERGRYAPERTEYVYRWRPETEGQGLRRRSHL
jgi:GNAT superfamily N-acetyltransferase